MPYLPPSVATSELTNNVAYHHPLLKQGKVRDIFDLGDDLLIRTTDRVSSDDHVLKHLIPNKGTVLNLITVLWLRYLEDDNHHLLACGNEVDNHIDRSLRGIPELQSQCVVVKKKVPAPMECVVRGYLSGSGWKSYQVDQHVCGIKLRRGYREGDKLDQPIFTPTTKSEDGHDDPLTRKEAIELLGSEKVFQLLKRRSLGVYHRGMLIAEEQAGIIIADTKFEMDRKGGLLDEVLTPDSSRFWPRKVWEEKQRQGGGTPASLDKQYLRDYLKQFSFKELSHEEAGKIELPDPVVAHLSEIYVDLFERLSGTSLVGYKRSLGIAA